MQRHPTGGPHHPPEKAPSVSAETKIRRKDLRQPDEFVTFSRQAITYVEQNRGLVFTLVGAIALVLVAVVAYRALSASREEAAATAYHSAHQLFADRKYPEAVTAFQDIVSRYGATAVGPLAQLEVANAELRADRPADAAAAYQKFLSMGPPTDYLRQSALAGLAYASERSGDAAAAKTQYAEAAAVPGPYGDEALVGEARTADAAGDVARAKDLYAQFLEKYPTSDLRGVVAFRLARLGGTPPAPSADAAAEDGDE